MKKKIANAVNLLLLIVSFIILMIPCMDVVYKNTAYAKENASALFMISKYPGNALPMYLLYAVCAIMCIISIISKNKGKDSRLQGVMSIVLMLSVNWNLITCGRKAEIITNNFPKELIEIVLFLIIVVAFAKRSNVIVNTSKNVENEKQQVMNNSEEITLADELKKYKDLLDSGTITQEEFDAKKKQLLGL